MRDSFEKYPADEMLKEMQAMMDELQYIYAGPLADLQSRFLRLQEKYSRLGVSSNKEKPEPKRMAELLAEMRSITAEYQAIVRNLRGQFQLWKTAQSFEKFTPLSR